MSKKYYKLYNNFIELSRNKILYKDFIKPDTFSDRLIFFLMHFAFFIKIYKDEKNSILDEYDLDGDNEITNEELQRAKDIKETETKLRKNLANVWPIKLPHPIVAYIQLFY